MHAKFPQCLSDCAAEHLFFTVMQHRFQQSRGKVCVYILTGCLSMCARVTCHYPTTRNVWNVPSSECAFMHSSKCGAG